MTNEKKVTLAKILGGLSPLLAIPMNLYDDDPIVFFGTLTAIILVVSFVIYVMNKYASDVKKSAYQKRLKLVAVILPIFTLLCIIYFAFFAT